MPAVLWSTGAAHGAGSPMRLRRGRVSPGISATGATGGTGNGGLTPYAPVGTRTRDAPPIPPVALLDRQSVRTTALGGERGDDPGTQGTGRTRHLLVETVGRRMAGVVPVASVSAAAGARRLFAQRGRAGKKLRLLWGEGTSRGQLVEWVAQPMPIVLRVV
jgi:hypothetical protein